MKPTEFIVENSIIAQEADDMHRDHEVQMARSQMYSAAQAAIEIHRLLKDISEIEGLEGWVQSKLTLASQYLESVRDYMKYEAVSQEPEMMAFAEAAANYAVEVMINEREEVYPDKQELPPIDDKSKSVTEPKKVDRQEVYPDTKKPPIEDRSKKLKEMATGGSSSAGSVATSVGGVGHKPTSGVPKKIGNSYKPKKVAVGKGIY